MKTILIVMTALLTTVLVIGKDKQTVASWYGEKYRGKATASGEPVN